jgi:hypothetical protein
MLTRGIDILTIDILVEAAGIEPASENLPLELLRA